MVKTKSARQQEMTDDILKELIALDVSGKRNRIKMARKMTAVAICMRVFVSLLFV